MIETIARAIAPLAWARMGNHADKVSFKIDRLRSLVQAKAAVKAIKLIRATEKGSKEFDEFK